MSMDSVEGIRSIGPADGSASILSCSAGFDEGSVVTVSISPVGRFIDCLESGSTAPASRDGQVGGSVRSLFLGNQPSWTGTSPSS